MDPHLIEAVVVLSIVERMINGWEATTSHRAATMFLERRAIAAFGRNRDFANEATAEAYLTLLPKGVDDDEVQNCWRLISTGLNLVRSCTLSIIETADSEQAGDAEVSGFQMERWIAKNAAGLTYLASLATSIKSEEPKSQRSIPR
ncbi:hypothetical protein LTR85_007100 [Meristemomyces frigidus]|nr:hypothetical protein LTR85_007100 [Meristemomyces frigidus]